MKWTLVRRKPSWSGPQQVRPAGPWGIAANDVRLSTSEYVEVVPASEVERLREALESVRQALEDWTMGRTLLSIQQIEAQAREALNAKESS